MSGKCSGLVGCLNKLHIRFVALPIAHDLFVKLCGPRMIDLAAVVPVLHEFTDLRTTEFIGNTVLLPQSLQY